MKNITKIKVYYKDTDAEGVVYYANFAMDIKKMRPAKIPVELREKIQSSGYG
jgi:acyl-CoA thioesterase FadM